MHFKKSLRFRSQIIGLHWFLSGRTNKLFVLLLIFSAHLLFGQNPEQAFKLAKTHFKQQEYFKASEYFELAWPVLENEKDHLLDAGIAHYHANQLDLSLKCLEQLLSVDPDFGKELHWALARSYHQQQNFLKAIQHYKNYYKEIGKNDPLRKFIKNEVLRCSKGNLYLRKEATALVENFGREINSQADEYAVCPSINFSGKYYFSSSRMMQRTADEKNSIPDQSDIFSTHQENGKWLSPMKMNPELNSRLNEEVMDFAQNGTVMFFYRGNHQTASRIFSDTFNDAGLQLKYAAFSYPMIAEVGDHAMSIFQDSILIFSSCRTGGYGAYDLYISALRNGKWTEPVNLGPKINGPFNEDYPFLAKDGRSLYFSSDNLNSMGGYDIFKIQYWPESGMWGDIEHLSIPINSPGNDTHFKLTGDALAAVFSSDRKISNYGKRDIYLAYFKESVEEQSYESHGTDLAMALIPGKLDAVVKNTKQNPRMQTDNPGKSRELIIDAFYYQGDDFLKDKKNKQNFDRLVDLMKTNKSIKLYLLGHSYNESAAPVNLYASIKKAEYLAEQFSLRGIESSRVICYGLGASYPIAKFRVNGMKSILAEQLNKRVEVFLVQQTKDQSLQITSGTPEMEEQIRLEKDSSFFESFSDLFYTIYLGDASSIMDHPLINNPSEATLITRSKNGSGYAYYAGNYSSFKEAKERLDLLHHSSVDIKGISACVGQKWLNENEIIDYVLRYPDLILYLDYLKENNAR